jgi:hypothetical protein
MHGQHVDLGTHSQAGNIGYFGAQLSGPVCCGWFARSMRLESVSDFYMSFSSNDVCRPDSSLPFSQASGQDREALDILRYKDVRDLPLYTATRSTAGRTRIFSRKPLWPQSPHTTRPIQLVCRLPSLFLFAICNHTTILDLLIFIERFGWPDGNFLRLRLFFLPEMTSVRIQDPLGIELGHCITGAARSQDPDILVGSRLALAVLASNKTLQFMPSVSIHYGLRLGIELAPPITASATNTVSFRCVLALTIRPLSTYRVPEGVRYLAKSAASGASLWDEGVVVDCSLLQ